MTNYEITLPPVNEKLERSLYLTFYIIKLAILPIAFACFFIAFYFSNFFWILFILAMANFVLFHVLQRKVFCFYDYVFYDNKVTLSKVINNKARRTIIEFTTDQIQKIGFIESNEAKKYFNDKSIKKKYAVHAKNKNVLMYFNVNNNGVNTLIILAFSKKFMAFILNSTKRSVLDSDFKENLQKYE